MPRDPEARLFHTLVLMGIGLTAGGVTATTIGCGGSTVTGKAVADAAADAADGAYATIHYYEPDAGSQDVYATIGYHGPDSGGYDAYAVILPVQPPEAGPDVSPGPADAAVDGTYPTIGFLPPDAGPG